MPPRPTGRSWAGATRAGRSRWRRIRSRRRASSSSPPGFAAERVSAATLGAGGSITVVLRPAALTETVTVTAGRRELRGVDTPAATTVVSSAELLSSAATTVDDALRFTPGFTLFRRSSSRAANPTTQGVTLRGLSASGASRTLVLADGVPLNDPFGGWVYWSRVPQAAIDRIEIVRGATSDLYGADAVGGVIQVVPADVQRTRARLSLEGGSLDTSRASGFGSTRLGADRHRRRRRAVRHRRRADHRGGGARPDRHAGRRARVVVAGERGVASRRRTPGSRWSAPASRASTRTAPTARRSRSTTPTSTRPAFAPAASWAAAPGRRPASRLRRPTTSRSPRWRRAGPARA